MTAAVGPSPVNRQEGEIKVLDGDMPVPRRSRIALIVALFAITCAVAACGGDDNGGSAGAGDGGTDTAAKDGGGKVAPGTWFGIIVPMPRPIPAPLWAIARSKVPLAPAAPTARSWLRTR